MRRMVQPREAQLELLVRRAEGHEKGIVVATIVYKPGCKVTSSE
jgi:hypothetical protein